MREEELREFDDGLEIERQKQEQRASKIPMVEWQPGRGLVPPTEEKTDEVHGPAKR